MKQRIFILRDKFILDNAKLELDKQPLDGSVQCVISNTGSKSARQRALNWIWNEDVAKSGMGGRHEDTKNGVHLVAKFRWAIPIFQRDDPYFNDLYSAWVKLYGDDEERMLYFTDKQVHTENMSVSQAAEFLTEFQRFYVGHGVALSDPDDKKLLEWRK